MLTRLLATCAVVLAAVLALLMGSTGYASADKPRDCPPGTTPGIGGWVCIGVTAPGQPGTDPGPGGGSADPGPAPACFHGPDQVPCENDQGIWFPGHQCYASPYDAPLSDPAWGGHTDGSLWSCAWCTGRLTGACDVRIIWLPPGSTPASADPEILAQSAADALQLATAKVMTAPRPPHYTLVGVETWLWVPPAQWQVLHKTVGVGGTTVSVTAAPDHVVWSVGPDVLSCPGPGRPWRASFGDFARTSCGYVYGATSVSQPGGVFSLSASIVYSVDWACAGVCSASTGSLGLITAPAGAAPLEVRQRQVVNG